LSGPGAALGVDMRDAFLLAVKLNGGKLGGLAAEVSVVDDQQKPDIGRQAVERFTKRDNVDLITGMVFSNVLLPGMPAILDSGTIYSAPTPAPKITQARSAIRTSPWLGRTKISPAPWGR
jgi:branched-chain amino acid transport system substrate-binding protein